MLKLTMCLAKDTSLLRRILILPFLLFSQTALAQSSALLVGGGCSDTLRSEMAYGATEFASRMTSLGWGFTSSYGGEKNSSDVKDKTGSTFTRAHFIEKLKEQGQKLGAGDQFLLNIITHGRYEEGGHGICLGDGTNLDLNDKEIHEQLALMQKKGVKIGIMDNSCYGGQTVDLFSRYGCVISTQVGDFPSIATTMTADQPQFGVTTVMQGLLKDSPKARVSLEDVFVETAMKYDQPGVFPQMSGLKRFQKSAIESAIIIHKEEDQLDDYRNFTKESITSGACISGDPGGLEKLLKDLERPIWSGYGDRLSRGVTFRSKEVREGNVRSLVKQIQDRQAGIKKLEAEQKQAEARAADLSKQFLKDLEKNQPVILEKPLNHSFSPALKAALQGKCREMPNDKLACTLPLSMMLLPGGVLGVTSPVVDQFHAGAADMLGGKATREVQLEWLTYGVSSADAAAAKLFKNHESHAAITEIENLRGHYQTVNENLRMEKRAVSMRVRELSQEINVSRGLSYLAAKSIFDNRKIKNCRSFVLNPRIKDVD